VGRIAYGAKFQLWNPDPSTHNVFPATFKEIVHLFLFMKPQENCPLSWMSNDILFYILNMCRHDWCKPSPRLAAQLAQEEAEEREQEEQERAERTAAALRAHGRGRGWLSSLYGLNYSNGGVQWDEDDDDDDDDDKDDDKYDEDDDDGADADDG
jgi:hypothetical protein